MPESWYRQVLEKYEKVHFLGATRASLLRRFKPYSCDSSRLVYYVTGGWIALYNDNLQKIQIQRSKNFQGCSTALYNFAKTYLLMPEYEQFMSEVKIYGGPKRYPSFVNMVNCLSWFMECYNTEKTTGTKVFTAFSSGFHAQFLHILKHLDNLKWRFPCLKKP